jgi:hypothetical protein
LLFEYYKFPIAVILYADVFCTVVTNWTRPGFALDTEFRPSDPAIYCSNYILL